MTTTSIIEGSLDAVSTVFEAWRSSPELVIEGSSSYADHNKSEITSLSLDHDDMKDDDDDYFCPLPDPFSARNHWDLLSSDKMLDSNLKQHILGPPSSLEISHLPTSVPDPPRRRTRPCCLFINYLGTRLPQPKPRLPPLVAASEHKEATSSPTPAPTMPTIVTPDFTIVCAPFPLIPARHMCPGKRPTFTSALNLKVPIHLTNLKLPVADQNQSNNPCEVIMRLKNTETRRKKAKIYLE